MTNVTPWTVSKALDEIARAAAYLHTRADGSGLSTGEKEGLSANISLRTLETVLAMYKDQLTNGPRPWDEEIPDLPSNLRGHWPK